MVHSKFQITQGVSVKKKNHSSVQKRISHILRTRIVGNDSPGIWFQGNKICTELYTFYEQLDLSYLIQNLWNKWLLGSTKI